MAYPLCRGSNCVGGCLRAQVTHGMLPVLEDLSVFISEGHQSEKHILGCDVRIFCLSALAASSRFLSPITWSSLQPRVVWPNPALLYTE